MAKMKKENKNAEELFNEAIQRLQTGQPLDGSEGVLTPLIKRLIEASLEGEMDSHIGDSRPNRRNGKGGKKVKTPHGEVHIETPRDRDGSFEPIILPKRARTLGPSLDNKIISLYSLGMSYQDISSHILELYGMELSKAQLSYITDRVWPEIEDWQGRVLDEVYPFVWMDALFYKVRQDGQIRSMAAYLVLGMNIEGEKDLLGIYLSETESASFWLEVLTDLETRGVKDILIASIDNLKGFKEAIATIFPKTDVQLCIVHQVRNSTRYVPWEDQREVIRDMKLIYKATTLEQAEKELMLFEQKWGEKHPAMVKSWKRNWDGLSTFYHYHPEIRYIMYTTNSIEGFNRQIRKATKTKGALPSQRSLYKLLYLVSKHVRKRWTKPRSWTKVMAIMAINYSERLGLE